MNKSSLQKRKITQKLIINIFRKTILLLCFLFFLSCNETFCKKIGGTWSINEIRVNGKDFKPYLYINTFGFHCNNMTAWFHASPYFDEDKYAKFEIINENGTINKIKIKSKIKIFNDCFTTILNKNDKTFQYHLILKSEKVYISAYKIIDDY